MHGAGNSFVMIEKDSAGSDDYSELAVKLCSEGEIKTDGMILVCPYEGQDADFQMLFYNSDGSLGEMCGNGARCIARYGFERRYADNADNIRIMTTAGIVTAKRISESLYRIRINDPSVFYEDFKAETSFGTVKCAYTELGNPGIPHAVVLSSEDEMNDTDSLRDKGREIRSSVSFKKGANTTFVVPEGNDTFRAITYERGVEDFTLACGTGSAATAIALSSWGLTDGNSVLIKMPGGDLFLEFEKENGTFKNIYLTGPTAYI